MLSKTLPKFNRFADLEEEKDLMDTVRAGPQMARGCGCSLSLPTYLLPLRQAKYDITLDILQVKCGGHD